MSSKARLAAIAATAAIVLLGTLYSVLNATYLDTSNPHFTALPHHLHATDYFANKKNPLNVYFTKKLWGWVTATFLFHFFTSPRATRTQTRLLQYILATSIWLAFTSWFFGPPVFDRLNASTGGVCVLHLPGGESIDVPLELCYTKTNISPETHSALFPASFLLPDGHWTGTPRLRRGHDVSGHIFLLTISALFLVDQLRRSFANVPGRAWPPLHNWAVAFTGLVITATLFATYTTSVYFHTPSEKFTGYALGLAAYTVVVLLPEYLHAALAPPRRTPVASERRTS